MNRLEKLSVVILSIISVVVGSYVSYDSLVSKGCPNIDYSSVFKSGGIFIAVVVFSFVTVFTLFIIIREVFRTIKNISKWSKSKNKDLDIILFKDDVKKWFLFLLLLIGITVGLFGLSYVIGWIIWMFSC